MSKHSHHKHKHKIKHRNKQYKLYYGIPHAHSSYSTGKGSPLEAYRYARKKKLNYLILTDHANFLKQKILLKGNKISKWDAQKAYSKRVNERHKYFTALCGFECKLKSIGDINVYNSEELPIQHFKGAVSFIKWLKQDKARLGCINHPHGPINQLLKYPELNEFLTVMEVGNGSYPYNYVRYYQKFFHFLDKGWKLGAVNGQDNHRDNWGDDENLTVILAENLNPRSILDAYRNRRTYATESASLRVNFKINTAIMGEILYCELYESLNFCIEIEDNRYAIERIQILSNGGKIIKDEVFEKLNRLNLSYSHEVSLDENWYSVIIYQCKNKQALTSPIFIEKKACE